MKFSAFFLALTAILYHRITEAEETGHRQMSHGSPTPPQFEPGDPQNCKQDANVLEILPTYGWDNLRNLPMGTIFQDSYSKCRVTRDRKYLIPNEVEVFPVKNSQVSAFSELIDHFTNYTSITARSINLGAHVGVWTEDGLGYVSGSFSESYQKMKQHQVEDKTVTTRVQLRYRMYNVQREPSARLHQNFRTRILDIAAHLQSNASDHAAYLADILVRDYGTHYVTSVEAGAAIVQEDQIKYTFVNENAQDTSVITATASANFLIDFLLLFGSITASYTQKVTSEMTDDYIQSRTSSDIHTFGGPPFRANFTLNDWVDNLANHLIEIDRAGDPLYYLIEPETFPELPLHTIQNLTRCVSEAVSRYYKYNTHKGCTDVDNPNFSFIANFDDGSCKPATNNYTFGGVYQTCSGGMCSPDMSQVNPKTGDYNCPPGYLSVPLFQGSGKSCSRHCNHFLLWTTSCHDTCIDETYTLNWCYATDVVQPNSGYLFGGTYTTTTENPFTNSKSCPPYFHALRFTAKNTEVYICISDDYEMGFRYSVPFAGFFSCKAGNPLALPGAKVNSTGQLDANGTVSQLAAFLLASGPASWPRKCPDSYSQHVVALTEGCEINYCVRANALSDQSLPTIRRPPFIRKPERLVNTTRYFISATGTLHVRSYTQQSWIPLENATKADQLLPLDDDFTWAIQLQEAKRHKEEMPKDTSASAGSSNIAVVAGISVTVITAVIAGAILILVLVRKRERRASRYEHIGSSSGSPD